MSDNLKEFSEALADVVENAAKGIVRVEGRRRLPATGFVWAENTIITAHHVVERSEGLQIGLPNGETVSAELIGRDPSTDIAVLRATTGDIALPNSGEGLRVGNLVLAIGRPGGSVQATLGVVSAIGGNELDEDSDWNARMQRRAEKMERRAEKMARRWGADPSRFQFSMAGTGLRSEGAIQTDVVMYPGFSGGPLVDASGVVRGLNTSAISRGASLTVPVATIQRVASTLVEHGRMRRGFLGIGAQAIRLQESVANEIGQDIGLLIVSVETGSPAEQGGLYVGDIVVALDGQAVNHVDELLALLTGDRVGKAVTVNVIRGGQLQQVDVTIAEKL
jgi:S1-C subfamily serine protease